MVLILMNYVMLILILIYVIPTLMNVMGVIFDECGGDSDFLGSL